MVWARVGCAIAVLAMAMGEATFAEAQTADEGVSAANEASATDVATSSGESPPLTLPQISVTATRNPIEAYEYPGMVTVINREEIQTYQPSTPADVLKFVPNVEFAGGPRQTGEVPSIRGFDGPDVVVLIDGARQNFNSAHQGQFFIDPSLLEGIEVLRGASSSLYGSGGNGGVISFRTLDASDLLVPGESFGVRASSGYQTVNEEPIGTVTGYAAPVEGFDLLGSFTKRKSDTIHLGNGEELDNSKDDILAGLAKASYDFADYHTLEAEFVAFHNDATEPSNGQGAGTGAIQDKKISSYTYRAGYQYHNPDDDLFDIDGVVYYTDASVDQLPVDDPTAVELKQDVDTIGLRLDNRSRLDVTENASALFTYGTEIYRDEQTGEDGDQPRDGVPDATANFYGVYAQGELSVTDAFGVVPGDILFIPGLRFDHYKSTSSIADDNSESAVSPRVGLSYLPTDWLLLFGSYGHAFRAPTFDELYLTGTHFQIPIGNTTIVNRFVPNPNLKPQKTRTVEFGAGLDFEDIIQPSDRFQIKGSHFRIKGKDFIDLSVTQPAPFVDCNPFIPGNCDGTTEAANVASAKLWGTEIEASYENDRFLFTLGYSTINGENEDTGAYLGVLSPDRLTVNSVLKLPEIDSFLGWRVYAADQFDKVNDPAEELPGYVVNDFYFAWQPSEGVLEGLRVDLGIDNAFDRAYSEVYTDADEPGRNFKGLVSYAVNW